MVNIIFILGLILLSTTTSYAGTWEIITHGGYDEAVSAWNKVALIFSDNNYTALFLSVAVLGAIILYLSVYTKIALGSKGNPLSGWGVPFMIGIVLYMGFMVPKDRIIIYDETLNRGPQAIDNIPRGVATIAGLLNKIEKGFTDIIWTSSDPSTDYRIQAGGAGFNALGATSAGLYNLPYSFSSTFENFIKDCVFVEMQRPGTSLDINKIQSGQQDYLTVITESANPAFYTTSYLNKTEGEPLTCSGAAQQIAGWLNNQNNVKPAIKAACAVAGYDPNIPQSLNACINATDNLIGKLTENQITSTLSGFAQQAIFAQVTANVTTSINPSLAIKALATSQSMSSFIGMGAHANSWIPVIKETLSAIAVGLVPLFAIVCVTPLVGKAFSIMAGMFVWLSVWGIVDAIIHSFAMEFAYKSAESLKISGGTSGLASMLMFPGYTVKVGALFGAIRWFGLMLSSIITAMFLKFGGTAMAMLAGSLSGTVQAAGASYGVSMLKNPSSVFSSEVMPAVGIHNAAVTVGGINNLAKGLGMHQGGSMAGQTMVGSELGARKIAEGVRGGMMQGIASGIGAGNVIDQVGFDTASRSSGNLYAYGIGSGMGFGNSLRAFQAGEIGSARNVADAQTFSNIAQKYGGVENLQRMISTKNYTALGQAIEEYAKQRGISYNQAAQEMGFYLGTREGLHTLAGKYHLDTVGEQGVLMTDTDKMLSETASAYAAFNFAKTLGYAGSWDDFAGRLRLRESQFSGGLFTLSEEGARRLNEQLQAQGYKNAHFSAGDRVTMAIDSNGNITVASGKRGAEKFTIDRAMVEKGTSVHTFNNRINERRNENIVTNLNITRDYTEVDLVIRSTKDAMEWSHLLKASGIQHAELHVGDTIHARLSNATGMVSTITITSGGKSETFDFNQIVKGKQETYLQDRKEVKGGSVYDSPVNTAIKNKLGETAADAWGKITGTVGEVGGVFGGVFKFFKVGGGKSSGGRLPKVPKNK